MPRRAKFALGGAAAGVGLLLITWYAALHVGFLERADRNMLIGFADLRRPRTESLASFIAGLCNPKPYVYLAAAPVLVALGRRRPRSALAIGAILLGANATTQLLKPLLAHPRPPIVLGAPRTISADAWPSGHATAAMSLALCSVLAAPARLRPLVASFGSVFAVAVSYSFLTLLWHFPSDVFGGFLVAGAWTLAGVAVVFAADARWPRGSASDRSRRSPLREVLAPLAAAWAGVLAIVAVVVLARPHQVVAYAHAHKTFMVGATAIGVLGLALATGVVLMLRAGVGSSGTAPAPRAARPRQRRSPPG